MADRPYGYTKRPDRPSARIPIPDLTRLPASQLPAALQRQAQSGVTAEDVPPGLNLFGADARDVHTQASVPIYWARVLADAALAVGERVSASLAVTPASGGDVWELILEFRDGGGALVGTAIAGSEAAGAGVTTTVHVQNIAIPATAVSVRLYPQAVGVPAGGWSATHAMLNRGATAAPYSDPPAVLGTFDQDDVPDGPTYGRTVGTYLTANKVAKLLRSSIDEPSANLFKRGADSLDDVLDSATSKKVTAAAVGTGGKIDLSLAGFLNKTLDFISDGASFARVIASYLTTGKVTKLLRSSVDEPSANLFKRNTDTLDDVLDGSTWKRVDNVTSANRVGWNAQEDRNDRSDTDSDSAAYWVRVLSWTGLSTSSARGSARVRISSSGGGASPGFYEFLIGNNWTTDQSIRLVAAGGLMASLRRVRLLADTTTHTGYFDVQMGNSSAVTFRTTVEMILGSGYQSPVYSWTKGATVPGTAQELGFDCTDQPITGQSYRSGTVVRENIGKFGIDGQLKMNNQATITQAGDLTSTVRQHDGVTQRVIAKGHLAGTVAHDGDITFAENFQSPPLVLFSGGITHEPRSLWGNLAQVIAHTAITAYDAAKPTYAIMQASNLTASGFKAILLLKQKAAAPVIQEDDFPSLNSLTATGQTTSATLSPGAATDQNYAVHYNVHLSVTAADEDTTGTAIVAVDTDDGLGGPPVERVRRTYILSSVVGDGGQTQDWTDEHPTINVPNLGASDTIRLRLVSFDTTNAQPGTCSVHGYVKAADGTAGVVYNTAVDNFASKTPDSDELVAWEAIEVSE